MSDAAPPGVAELQALVDEQAEDDGLWFDATTAPEAYLQQELRRLHAAVEAAVAAADITSIEVPAKDPDRWIHDLGLKFKVAYGDALSQFAKRKLQPADAPVAYCKICGQVAPCDCKSSQARDRWIAGIAREFAAWLTAQPTRRRTPMDSTQNITADHTIEAGPWRMTFNPDFTGAVALNGPSPDVVIMFPAELLAKLVEGERKRLIALLSGPGEDDPIAREITRRLADRELAMSRGTRG